MQSVDNATLKQNETSFLVRPAETFRAMESVYRPMHACYVDAGFIAPSQDRMLAHYPIFDEVTATIELSSARGIDPARLVFAGRLKLDQHLARHRLADLFLDTLPINAHTTGSDALWAGLPLRARSAGDS